MHCEYCGRNNETESCIHFQDFGQKDQTFLLSLIMAIPAILNGVYFNILNDFDLINYLQVGSISIIIVLIILLISYYRFNKLYIVIFFGCHQRIERSIKVNKKPFILCARCTGIMVGMFSTIFISLISFNYWWLLIFSIPLVIDGVVQKKTAYISNNPKRFLTGFLTGPSVVLIFGFIHFLISKFIVSIVLNIL